MGQSTSTAAAGGESVAAGCGPSRALPPLLERALARGRWSRAGQRECLPVLPPPEQGSAALAWLAEFTAGGSPTAAGEGYWACALPVAQIVSGPQVRLFKPPLTPPEAAQLSADLAPLLASSGLQLYVSASGRWYLNSDQPLPEYGNPAAYWGQPVAQRVPRGSADALIWARLSTEIEMFLYDHPLNEARRRAGALPLTTLWLWGSGRCPEAPASSQWLWQHLASDDPVWRGWAQLAGAGVEASSQLEAAVATPRAGATLVVYSGEHSTVGDVSAELSDGLARGEATLLRSAQRHLAWGWPWPSRGGWRCLELQATPAGPVCTVTRARLWRFWRRRAQAARWLYDGRENTPVPAGGAAEYDPAGGGDATV